MKHKILMTLALLLTAVGGAWAQTPTIYFQQDYATETVDWSTGTSGRYTPIVENGYLTVAQNKRNNNGTTLTCTATQGKVDAGKDFTMTFNVKLGASNNQDATEFNIYDSSNSGYILSLAEGERDAKAWKINGGTQTATVSAGGGKSLDELSWIFVQVTSIAGGKTYLTLKDEQNNIIDGFDKTEIPTISVAGGLGKMTFVTSRYLANFAIDNVLVRDVEDDAAASGPIDVTTNAASEQDLFTEASFTMPASDATVSYDIVRDMQDEANPVTFSGLPTNDEPIVVKKGSDGKYQPAEALTIQLIDPLAAAEAQNIIAADGITIKVLVGAENGQGAIDYDQENPITLEAFLADTQPGYYWIKAVPTDETTSPYIGTVYSSELLLIKGYEVTVPAGEYITYYRDEPLYADPVSSADAQLYTITSVSTTDGTATLSDAIATAPSSTPLLVYNSNTSEDKTFLLIPADAEPNLALTVAPEFIGTPEATTIAASTATQNNYALNGKEFVWVKNALAIAANKCYLSVAASNARAITIVSDSEATGIRSMDNGQLIMDNWYDLNGRKLQGKPTRKGVYIQNGQKVVVK